MSDLTRAQYFELESFFWYIKSYYSQQSNQHIAHPDFTSILQDVASCLDIAGTGDIISIVKFAGIQV